MPVPEIIVGIDAGRHAGAVCARKSGKKWKVTAAQTWKTGNLYFNDSLVEIYTEVVGFLRTVLRARKNVELTLLTLESPENLNKRILVVPAFAVQSQTVGVIRLACLQICQEFENVWFRTVEPMEAKRAVLDHHDIYETEPKGKFSKSKMVVKAKKMADWRGKFDWATNVRKNGEPNADAETLSDAFAIGLSGLTKVSGL